MGFVFKAQKNRAEVRRERKSEITSALSNAKPLSIKELRKIILFLPKNVRLCLYFHLGFYYIVQILTSKISIRIRNLP